MLRRAKHDIADVAAPDIIFCVEHDLGIGSISILGPDADRTFERIVGHEPPEPQRSIASAGVSIAWLAPDEWIVMGEEEKVEETLARLNESGGDAVLAVNLSHGRTSMLLGGLEARAALAAHCPLDLWDKNFPVFAVARSLLGETRMFLARLPDASDGPRFRIIVDQTMAPYAARLLAPSSTSASSA